MARASSRLISPAATSPSGSGDTAGVCPWPAGVSGVEDVVRFDENCIVTTTSAGTLIITGEELHIGKLSLDGGEMQVDGRIDAVTYEDTEVRQGSFLSRLFG